MMRPEPGLSFILALIAMVTKKPEMLQTMRFASIQCSKKQLQQWLSAPNPAGVRGCTALPQILYAGLRGLRRGVEGRRQGGRRGEVMLTLMRSVAILSAVAAWNRSLTAGCSSRP